MEDNRPFDLEKEAAKAIRAGRNFMKMSSEDTPDWEAMGYRTDQELKKQQPPLYKAPMGGEIIPLPADYHSLKLEQDIVKTIFMRKSSRVYTQGRISLQMLSFLLWATQGVKGIRGKNYATLRTVPCGGARHEFECYLAVRNVEGLAPGYYHYMPDRHALELIREEKDEQLQKDIGVSLAGQNWACRASLVMFYSIIPYRAEWRYGVSAHRAALIDSGHIVQNLYLACSAAGLGTCAVAAVETEIADRLFGLDGEEEFIFYCAPVGTISPDREKEEADIYAFLKDEAGAADPQ